MVRKIRVKDKRGYSYKRIDVGKPGRGKPIIPPKKVIHNILGPAFFSQTLEAQKTILAKEARVRGEKQVQGQLQYIARLFKRTQPKYHTRALKLGKWLAGAFVGKKQVK